MAAKGKAGESFAIRGQRWLAVVVMLVATTMSVHPVQAQPLTTNDAVARIFEEEINPDWFGAAFLAQVPVDQIVAIVESFVGDFGPLVAVDGTGGELVTRFERAEMPTQIALDDAGRIVGLFLGRRCRLAPLLRVWPPTLPPCLGKHRC